MGSTSRDASNNGAGQGAGKAGSAGDYSNSSATGAPGPGTGSAGPGLDSGPAPAGLESVGVVAGEDDAARLLNETEAALRSAPPDELSEQLEQGFSAQAAQLTSWAQITGDGVDIVAICFLPQWNLTDKERTRVSERLSRMLDLLCPVRMSPVIEAVIGVALTVGGIAASRALTNGGRLPPLGPVRAKPAQEPAPEPAKRDPLTVTSLTE